MAGKEIPRINVVFYSFFAANMCTFNVELDKRLGIKHVISFRQIFNPTPRNTRHVIINMGRIGCTDPYRPSRLINRNNRSHAFCTVPNSLTNTHFNHFLALLTYFKILEDKFSSLMEFGLMSFVNFCGVEISSY